MESYLDGETPNPCVRCNRLIKFGALLEQATRLGAESLPPVTMPSRIIAGADGAPRLLAAVDARKDQSYFLGAIGRAALARAPFPLLGERRVRMRSGSMPVSSVFRLQRLAHSQDVCFLSDAGYGVPLLAARPEVTHAKGLIVHRSGKLLGRHDGFWRYTVGQRKGLVSPGVSHSMCLNYRHHETGLLSVKNATSMRQDCVPTGCNGCVSPQTSCLPLSARFAIARLRWHAGWMQAGKMAASASLAAAAGCDSWSDCRAL